MPVCFLCQRTTVLDNFCQKTNLTTKIISAMRVVMVAGATEAATMSRPNILFAVADDWSNAIKCQMLLILNHRARNSAMMTP
jgi:hypothetical protein